MMTGCNGALAMSGVEGYLMIPGGASALSGLA